MCSAGAVRQGASAAKMASRIDKAYVIVNYHQAILWLASGGFVGGFGWVLIIGC